MFKKWMAIILTFTFSSWVVLNNAQAAEAFEAEKFPYTEMQIQLMPEFDYPDNWPKDEPSLLVGYYGKIVNESGKDFSGTLEFPLPVKDRNFSVYLIAEFPEDNKPEVQRPFKIDKEKGVVTWEPGTPIKSKASYNFVIEYYANPFSTKGADKQFDFEFIPAADIEKLDVIVYNPLESKEFSLEPAPLSKTKSEYGQELNHYQYTKVKSGKAVSYTASYKKEGNESSLSIIGKMNPPNDEDHNGTAAAGQTGKNGTGSTERPIIDTAGASIIGVSIVIAALLIFFGIRGSHKSAAVRQPKKHQSKNLKAVEPKSGAVTDEKKKLRSMLLNGKIDQKSYEEKMKKLI